MHHRGTERDVAGIADRERERKREREKERKRERG
jgi:hypothetical protein